MHNIKYICMIIILIIQVVGCENNKISVEIIDRTSSAITPKKISNSTIKGDVFCEDNIEGHFSIFVIQGSDMKIINIAKNEILFQHSFGFTPLMTSITTINEKNINYNEWGVVLTSTVMNNVYINYFSLQYNNNDIAGNKFHLKLIGKVNSDCQKLISISGKGYKVFYQNKELNSVHMYDFMSKTLSTQMFDTSRIFYTQHNCAFDGRFIYQYKVLNDNVIFYNKFDFYHSYDIKKTTINNAPLFLYNANLLFRDIYSLPVIDIGGQIISPNLGSGVRLNYDGHFKQTASNIFLHTTKGLYLIDYINNNLFIIEKYESSAISSIHNSDFAVRHDNNKLYLYQYSEKNRNINIYNIDIDDVSNIKIFIDDKLNVYIITSSGVYTFQYDE